MTTKQNEFVVWFFWVFFCFFLKKEILTGKFQERLINENGAKG